MWSTSLNENTCILQLSFFFVFGILIVMELQLLLNLIHSSFNTYSVLQQLTIPMLSQCKFPPPPKITMSSANMIHRDKEPDHQQSKQGLSSLMESNFYLNCFVTPAEHLSLSCNPYTFPECFARKTRQVQVQSAKFKVMLGRINAMAAGNQRC